jgi:hypothetical protein
MKRFILIAGMAAALLAPMLAPATAYASCEGRKMTGTVLGGVGGALIGNSIAGGGGGAILGGLGGAVLGHEIAKSGCGGGRREAYYGRPYRGEAPPRAVRYVYYDQYGDPVSDGSVPPPEAIPAAYRRPTAPACRTEAQPYYDSRGALVQGSAQVCAR